MYPSSPAKRTDPLAKAVPAAASGAGSDQAARDVALPRPPLSLKSASGAPIHVEPLPKALPAAPVAPPKKWDMYIDPETGGDWWWCEETGEEVFTDPFSDSDYWFLDPILGPLNDSDPMEDIDKIEYELCERRRRIRSRDLSRSRDRGSSAPYSPGSEVGGR